MRVGLFILQLSLLAFRWGSSCTHALHSRVSGSWASFICAPNRALPPPPCDVIPAQTIEVARAAFPKGNPSIRMRDALGPIDTNPAFAALVSHTCRSAEAPAQLALITVMPCAEGLSDVQAADAVRARIDWNYALALDLTDSTHVLAAIQTLNRLECVGETLRHVLNVLAIAAPSLACWLTWSGVERCRSRSWTLQPCGRPHGGEYFTLRIDAIPREGITFTNARAMPLCPQCRTRIMTGCENAKKYNAFGHLDPNDRTFSNVMKDARYATGIVGKWQLAGHGYDALVGTSPEKAGFDELLLWQEKSGDAKGSRYWEPTLTTNGKTKINTMSFGADIQNEFAVEYVEYIEWHRDRLILRYYPMALIHLILRLAEIAIGTTVASSIMAHVPQVG
jgi:Sulfatase